MYLLKSYPAPHTIIYLILVEAYTIVYATMLDFEIISMLFLIFSALNLLVLTITIYFVLIEIHFANQER